MNAVWGDKVNGVNEVPVTGSMGYECQVKVFGQLKWPHTAMGIKFKLRTTDYR